MRRNAKPLAPDREAVVTLTGGEWPPDNSMVRIALFVYRTTRGFAWVEDSYLDPYGSSRPADHVWEGELTEHLWGFACKGVRGTAVVVRAAEADRRDSGVAEWTRRFDWARQMIEQKGRTMDEERDCVLAACLQAFESP